MNLKRLMQPFGKNDQSNVIITMPGQPAKGVKGFGKCTHHGCKRIYRDETDLCPAFKKAQSIRD